MSQARLIDNPQDTGRAYGAHLAKCLGLPEPPTHVHRSVKTGLLAVTEIRSRLPPLEPTPPMGYDDAYHVAVHLKSFRRELWMDGKLTVAGVVHAGDTHIIDLRGNPRALVKDALHSVQFYMPMTALKAYAERNDMPGFGDLIQPSSVGHDDPVMRHLAGAAAAALRGSREATVPVLDAILDAVCAHVLGRYGIGRRKVCAPHGLAPWQERRAKQVMEEHLNISVSDVAMECGLSVGHFSRAFKRSTGIAPHQWQIGRRINRAQALLSNSTLPIAEIALRCGFASQSHFQTTFKQTAGISPGCWRRSGATWAGSARP